MPFTISPGSENQDWLLIFKCLLYKSIHSLGWNIAMRPMLHSFSNFYYSSSTVKKHTLNKTSGCLWLWRSIRVGKRLMTVRQTQQWYLPKTQSESAPSLPYSKARTPLYISNLPLGQLHTLQSLKNDATKAT